MRANPLLRLVAASVLLSADAAAAQCSDLQGIPGGATWPQEECRRLMNEAFARQAAQAASRPVLPSDRIAKDITAQQRALALAMAAGDVEGAAQAAARATDSLVFPMLDGGAGISAFEWAAQRGQARVVAALLGRGVPTGSTVGPDRRPQDQGGDALSLAIEGAFGHRQNPEQHLQTIELLLRAGASPRIRQRSGRTALGTTLQHWWQDRELTERIVGVLLRHGADLDEYQVGAGGRTALSSAANGGDLAFADYLLRHGASASAHGSIAVAEAASGRQNAMVRVLLAKGADPTVGLATAVVSAFQPASREIAMLLLDAGARANQCLDGTMPPCKAHARPLLFIALDRADLDLGRALLAHGADPNLPSGADETTLGLILQREARRYDDPKDKFDRLATLQLLLRAGADPSRASHGQRPLSLVPDEDLGLYTALLDRGAQGQLLQVAGETLGPITTAILSGRPVLAGELVRRARRHWGADERHVLRAAVLKADARLVRLLVASGADCRSQGPMGEGPLHLAAQVNSAELVEELVKCGVDVDARTVSVDKARKLFVYAPPALNGLLPVDLADGGMTALMVAATRRRGSGSDVATSLLRAGADRTLRSESGRTAQAWADESGNTAVADVLRAAEQR